ncbi:MAG: FAD-dependent oxidoreductase [Alkalibacterium sp.]|nr:FAD-dependent oxidoreductase [Alkalibacterium sp.]
MHGAARGSKVGLVEMQDFAGGTSSRSTKLVHGGLRYLKQFDVELVADVAKERKIIGKNAPHIVQPAFMLMPVYDEPGHRSTHLLRKLPCICMIISLRWTRALPIILQTRQKFWKMNRY